MKTEPEFKLGDTVRMKPDQVKLCPKAVHGPFILDACDMQDIERGYIRRMLKERYEIVEKPMNIGYKFKVGDRALHKATKHREYVVTFVRNSDGWLKFEGFDDIGFNDPQYYEPVVEKPMVDFTKPVTTRDGRKVRILCTDRKWRTDRPIVALVEDSDGETVKTYDRFGCSSLVGKEYKDDLINPPVKKYINLFKDDVCRLYYDTREEAEKAGNASKNASYIKTIEVEL